jgi:hypothetical protein
VRAHDFARFGWAIAATYQTDSKVRNPNIVAFAAEQNILRLDMNDPGGVRRVGGACDLQRDLQNGLYRPGIDAQPIRIAEIASLRDGCYEKRLFVAWSRFA